MRGLVEYSSSSEEQEGDGSGGEEQSTAACPPPAPPPPPPPPPRVRSFPHVPGQFAVHTHAPVEVDAALAARLRGLVAALAPTVPGLTCMDALQIHPAAATTPATPPATLHLSLSRVAPLASRDVPALIDGLAATLAGAAGLPSAGFELGLPALAVLENDDGTRCFLAAAGGGGGPAPPAHAAFRAAVAAVDAAGALVGLPPYYARPAPHVSFAWAPGAAAAALRGAVAACEWRPRPPWTAPVRCIACRVGKRVVVVWRASG